MGTFILSFIGNGFVESTQDSPLLQRFTPQVRATVGLARSSPPAMPAARTGRFCALCQSALPPP